MRNNCMSDTLSFWCGGALAFAALTVVIALLVT